MKSDEVKLVLCAPTYTLSEKMLSCKCFPRVSTMPTPTYDWVNSVVIKNAIFLLNKKGKRILVCTKQINDTHNLDFEWCKII
jgi:hypothetical protein